MDKAVKYIISCQNMDGGFGCTPGGESHAGQSTLYIIFHHFCLNVTFSMLCYSMHVSLFLLKICFFFLFSTRRECCLWLCHSLNLLFKLWTWELVFSSDAAIKRGVKILFSLAEPNLSSGLSSVIRAYWKQMSHLKVSILLILNFPN